MTKSPITGTAPPKIKQKGTAKTQPKQRKSTRIKDLSDPNEVMTIRNMARKTQYALLQQVYVQSQLSGLSLKDITDLSAAFKQLHGCMIEELKIQLASKNNELDGDDSYDEDVLNLPTAELHQLISNVKRELK